MVLVKASQPITKDKLIPRIMFMGVPSTDMTFIRHKFGLDGVLEVSNEWQDKLTIGLIEFGYSPTVELYEDRKAEIVAYRLVFKYGTKTYRIWIYFKFRDDPYKVKITIQGELPIKGELKLPFIYPQLNTVKRKLVKNKCLWYGTFDPTSPNIPLTGVGVDYSDVDGARFDEANNKMVFTVNTVFRLDPSTVGTSTASVATRFPFQRKTFFASGLHWAFYSDGANMVYRTSSDGVTWSSATTIRTCADAREFSIWFDGTYVHYVYCRVLTNQPIYYRRGTPNSDGSITWPLAEQTARAGASATRYENVFVTVDSGGYPWIGYLYYWLNPIEPELPDLSARVTKSSTNDGTWVVASGFPYILNDLDQAWAVTVVPLTNLRIYAIYAYDNAPILGRLWTGSWGSEETASSYNISGFGRYHSVVAEGDDVHLVYHRITANEIRYCKRTYGVGWGTDTLVQSGVTSTSVPVLSLDASNSELYCFWAGSPTVDYIYYKKCVAGTWDADPTILVASIISLTTGQDNQTYIFGTLYRGQSFTAKHSDTLPTVRLYLRRAIGTDPVDLTIYIYNADEQGRPVGSPLATGTIPSFTDNSFAWRTCNFASPASLTKDNIYCIVATAPTGDGNNCYTWGFDGTSPPYTEGNVVYSTDGGATWVVRTDWDNLFEVWMDGPLTANDTLTCFYKDYSGKIGLLYMTQTASPYNVRYAFLTVVVVVAYPGSTAHVQMAKMIIDE